VIVVASVSCIYNLGSPAEYEKVALELKTGMKARQVDVLKRLTQLYYERNEFEFKRGTFRVRGESIDIYPSYQDYAVRLNFFEDKLVSIEHFDPLTGVTVDRSNLPNERRGSHTKSLTQNEQEFLEHRMLEGSFTIIFPAKHYITAEDRRESAMKRIEEDLAIRLKELRAEGKELVAYRLEQRTNYDLEMIKEIGYCKGIENYSYYFDGRQVGDAPYTLLDFFKKDYLTIIDESHITVPQIRAMYNGDRSRKSVLVEHGFRLPSALENRPLQFEEFLRRTPQVVYTSATPSPWEISMSGGVTAEQLIRPTGIADPLVDVLPTKGQVQDLQKRIEERVANKQRVLVTTLTKRMAEELSSYLLEKGIKVTYLHSDVETLERSDILDNLRKGEYDVLVGINLLREGLDLPEVSLVAILDADKEGFLRSETSLVLIMGRAARHIDGHVVMYADRVTDSMKRALGEVERRRKIQLDYNEEHGITPMAINKPIRKRLIDLVEEAEEKKVKYEDVDYAYLPPKELKKHIKTLELEMKYQAELLDFEKAAEIRDNIKKLKKYLIK
jgi:excinuclease ABC subunit B